MTAPTHTPTSSAEDRTRAVVEQFYGNSLRADIEGVATTLHRDVVNPEASTPAISFRQPF
jgi:hypothetical protein